MPFDPFFSSANKKHYISNPEAEKLAQELLAMSSQERCKVIDSWWDGRTPTVIQRMALKRVRFLRQGWRWARVHADIEKRCEKAARELANGKRVLRVLTNARPFSTTGSHVCAKQARSFRS